MVDWHFWIYPVLVIEIDAVGFKALKRLFNHLLDVLRSAIKTTGFYVKAKFACDEDFVAKRSERFSDKLFVRIRSVNFGCIKQPDALFIGCTYDLNALVSICRGGP